MKSENWHIICEKDVGLFSLIQQVISHIPLAQSEGRVPVVLYGSRCCYWTENGYADKHNVWEYYFEPLIGEYTSDSIPGQIKTHIQDVLPDHESPGYHLNHGSYVSNHFGDHPELEGKSLKITYLWDDPSQELREITAEIIRQYIRPRPYLMAKVQEFFLSKMADRFTIGVHIRATDVNDLKTEYNIHRRYSYQPEAYIIAIEKILKGHPKASVFIATDSQDALGLMIKTFPNRVIHYSSIYHTDGALSGKGPTGWGVPGYLSGDAEKAAQNGEEAIIDYLLLSKCQHLIHNGSGLARTALLRNPDLPHFNVHSRKAYFRQFFSLKNFELYFFLKIVIQKKVRQWRKLAKQKITNVSA